MVAAAKPVNNTDFRYFYFCYFQMVTFSQAVKYKVVSAPKKSILKFNSLSKFTFARLFSHHAAFKTHEMHAPDLNRNSGLQCTKKKHSARACKHKRKPIPHLVSQGNFICQLLFLFGWVLTIFGTNEKTPRTKTKAIPLLLSTAIYRKSRYCHHYFFLISAAVIKVRALDAWLKPLRAILSTLQACPGA